MNNFVPILLIGVLPYGINTVSLIGYSSCSNSDAIARSKWRWTA